MWQCEWRASGNIWWPNLQPMQVAPSGGQNWKIRANRPPDWRPRIPVSFPLLAADFRPLSIPLNPFLPSVFSPPRFPFCRACPAPAIRLSLEHPLQRTCRRLSRLFSRFYAFLNGADKLVLSFIYLRCQVDSAFFSNSCLIIFWENT